jgi:hypothetical protein
VSNGVVGGSSTAFDSVTRRSFGMQNRIAKNSGFARQNTSNLRVLRGNADF